MGSIYAAKEKGSKKRGKAFAMSVFPFLLLVMLAGSYWSMSIIQGKDQKFGYSGIALV